MSEVRVVDAATGGAKGSKIARFDMIPADVLEELATHYGRGEAKYPSDERGLPNWMRGYRWRLSIAAILRHLFAWVRGEDADEETGSNHLIAVVWHAIALRTFQLHRLGTDDRLHTLITKPEVGNPDRDTIRDKRTYGARSCSTRAGLFVCMDIVYRGDDDLIRNVSDDSLHTCRTSRA